MSQSPKQKLCECCIKPACSAAVYTVSQKWRHQTHGRNSVKCQPFLTSFSLANWAVKLINVVVDNATAP